MNQHGPNIPQEDLYVYYDFKNPRCFDATKAFLVNLADRGNDLVSVQANTAFESVRGGLALNKGANTGDMVRVNQDVALNTSPFTIVVTFEQDYRTSTAQSVFGNEGFNSSGYKFNLNETTSYFSISNTANPDQNEAVNFGDYITPIENTIVQLAITANTTDYAKVFVNGDYVTERQLIPIGASATSYFTIGGNQSGSGFKGNVYNFLVYTRELSYDELRNIYNATKGRYT